MKLASLFLVAVSAALLVFPADCVASVATDEKHIGTVTTSPTTDDGITTHHVSTDPIATTASPEAGSKLLDEEICLFVETDQLHRNYKHCSAASCGCGIFWSVPCCWLSYTSICPQVHTCSLWNASCTSNTLLRRHGSLGDSNLRTLC